MATPDNIDFAKRLKRIEKSQKKFARVKHNPKDHNMAIKVPNYDKKKKRTPISTWLVRAVLAYVMFVGVKSFLVYQMGQEAYDARIAELAATDRGGQAMAFVMGTGPFTKVFIDLFSGTERSLNEPATTDPSATDVTPSALPQIDESATQQGDAS